MLLHLQPTTRQPPHRPTMPRRATSLTRTLLLAVLALLLATTLLARALPTPQDSQIEALPACTLNDDPEAGTCTTTTDGEFTAPVVDNEAAQDGGTDPTTGEEEEPADGVANLFRRHWTAEDEVLEVAAGDADDADVLFRRDAVVEDGGEDGESAAEEVVPTKDGDENDAVDFDDSGEPAPVEAGDERNIVLMDAADADDDAE
ncbi:hypothetical protein AMAG_16669 [Allomyces macrogynus ATCC 38327]|uniref:Uncharacterized protein n=1 Tax=Allomyces macrogynus (strain ATCC 38327) TaxID=578462 RepID=A0A0L0TBP2_ALLM3|nr:hypothetical protein AMAG_16669 [Allomyces macrogynus ATCC 38327]|eukprot:KNE72182.1 hypothetical protein AMAG_16669 [Allomyces macrogynus ATCC 38327]